MSSKKYYSADLSISIVEIKATTRKQAEAIMNEFIDRIGPVMADQICWDECNWTVEKNVLDEKEGVWHTE
jgi:hypothetical protein